MSCATINKCFCGNKILFQLSAFCRDVFLFDDNVKLVNFIFYSTNWHKLARSMDNSLVKQELATI